MFPSLSLYLGVYSQITFGGMPVSAKPSSGGRENYIGCMEAIHYNGDNITNLARRRKVDTSSFVRAKFACLFLSKEHCRALQCLVEIVQELHRGVAVAGVTLLQDRDISATSAGITKLPVFIDRNWDGQYIQINVIKNVKQIIKISVFTLY